MQNVTGLGQFQNYFTGPYLAGDYAYQVYNPLLANPFLNGFLLAQDLLSGQARTGPLDRSIGASLFGVNNTNQQAQFSPGFGFGGGMPGPLPGFSGGSPFGGFSPAGAVFSPFGGSPFGGSPFGGDPFGMFGGVDPFSAQPNMNGLFRNAPIQSQTAGRLATFDPVIRNSILTETLSPIFGLMLAEGRVPDFLARALFRNA